MKHQQRRADSRNSHPTRPPPFRMENGGPTAPLEPKDRKSRSNSIFTPKSSFFRPVLFFPCSAFFLKPCGQDSTKEYLHQFRFSVFTAVPKPIESRQPGQPSQSPQTTLSPHPAVRISKCLPPWHINSRANSATPDRLCVKYYNSRPLTLPVHIPLQGREGPKAITLSRWGYIFAAAWASKKGFG